MLPKVLVAAPSWNKHRHVIDRWIEQAKSFDYSNYDVVVAVSDKDTEYGEYIKSKGVNVIEYKHSEGAFKRLTDARNLIRQYVIDYGFDYLFSIDTDTFVPKDSITRLLSHKKDLVGFLCKIGYPPTKYCVLKSGWLLFHENKYPLDYYDDEEIEKWKPNLVKVYACAMSPMLISRKVLEKVYYVNIPKFNIGEDVMFWTWANEYGFEFYVDTSVEAEHLNVSWDGVLK